MPLFTWSEDLSVLVPEMDAEHHKLIGIINDLYDSMKSGKSKEALGNIFSDLLDYTKTHFKDEENLMMKVGYPGLQDQMAQHKVLIDGVKEKLDKFNAGTLFISVELMGFLKDWLTNHIQNSDKKYGIFIRDKK